MRTPIFILLGVAAIPTGWCLLTGHTEAGEHPWSTAPKTPTPRVKLEQSSPAHVRLLAGSEALLPGGAFIVPPCRGPYNLTTPVCGAQGFADESTELQMLATARMSFSQWKQDLVIKDMFREAEALARKEGRSLFFLDSGAFDGEHHDNTLKLECDGGWQGLLVEPDHKNLLELKRKCRKAHLFEGAMSPSGGMEILRLMGEGESAFLTETVTTYRNHPTNDVPNTIKIIAVPLELFASELGITTVDFWSLDVEGVEGKVLLTTNFSKVEVGVIMVDLNGDAVADEVTEAMSRAGFVQFATVSPENLESRGAKRELTKHMDTIFYNPMYFERRGLSEPTVFSGYTRPGSRKLVEPASYSSRAVTGTWVEYTQTGPTGRAGRLTQRPGDVVEIDFAGSPTTATLNMSRLRMLGKKEDALIVGRYIHFRNGTSWIRQG